MPVLWSKSYSVVSIFSLRVGGPSLFWWLRMRHQVIIVQLFLISTNWRSNFMSHMLNKKNQIGSQIGWSLQHWKIGQSFCNPKCPLGSMIADWYVGEVFFFFFFLAWQELEIPSTVGVFRKCSSLRYDEEECGIKSQEIGERDLNILMMKDDICCLSELCLIFGAD